MFKPNIQQMVTPIRIKLRTETIINGAPKISYIDASPALDFCNWKSKGGTESTQSGALVVYDTAELVMWYRSDITIRDRVLLNDNSALTYEIINIENVEMRNQFLVLKVQRVVNA